MNTQLGQRLYVKAKSMLPGGTQLLSKRPEQFAPGLWPPYYRRAAGCSVWDLDGNRFTDMTSMGIGSCLLGYACPEVNDAVKRVVDDGSMSTLNCAEEVELAGLLLELHPWAAKVRYARTGGEIMAVAVRIARAYTGRDHIAFCGYHGWHDWYLAANLADDRALDEHLLPGLPPKGVPRGLRGTVHAFHYNAIEEVERIIDEQGGSLAAIVMEPLRASDPQEGFLERVRDLATRNGSVLVFDEVTSGFRFAPGGAHLLWGVNPDISVFAKALGNGFPMAAAIGEANVMEAAQESFISSTYWTERVGPAAAIATVRRLSALQAPRLLEEAGARVREVWERCSRKSGMRIEITGRPALLHFAFRHDEPHELATLFTQEMLERGFLANPSFYAAVPHTAEVIDKYGRAAEESFRVIRNALDRGRVKDALKGDSARGGFARLT